MRNLDQKKLMDFNELLGDVSKYLEFDEYTTFLRSIKMFGTLFVVETLTWFS